jgi:ubiquinone biosynthesis protein
MAEAPPRSIGRISEIAQVAVRHGFGYFFHRNRLTDLIPGGNGRPTTDEPTSERGRHLRELLDELGPTFVKFGQLLSMRPDILPPDIIAELRGLQDDVSPFPYEEIEEMILAELGQPVERLFTSFDPVPLAAASIGQVHRAVLPNGRDVVVKVQRPGAPRQIEADLNLMYQGARLAKERVRALDFIDAQQLVDEFARSIRQELDYRLEGRNAETFRKNFAGHPHVRIPRVFWTYTRQRVLTLEYMEGTQLADIDMLGWTPEQRHQLAEVLTEAWMTMIFRHGFFHADPHPANVLVFSPERIGLVDFGLAGRLTDEDVTKATRLFIDVAHENIEVLPKALADLGVRYPKEREEEFVAELRDLFYRYYGATLAEIDPQQVIRDVFGLIYRMNLKLPTRFMLLDKAIATLGSVTIELSPEFNVFEVAKPYARSLLLGRYTPGRVASRARREAINLTRIAAELPYQLHDTLEEIRDGQLEVGFVHKGLDDFMDRLVVTINRLVIALVVAAGLVASSLLGIFATGGPEIAGINALSVVGFVFSGILGLWLLWGVLRSGRL